MPPNEGKEKNWAKDLKVEILTKTEVSQFIGTNDQFYVYILWKMYKNPPIPFYVGKGHFQRILKHDVKSDEGNNVYKTRIIKKHIKEGLKIGYSIVDFYTNENEALEKEKDIIQLLGRADLEQGPLANKTEGGDGTLGHLALKGGESFFARPVIADNKLYSCLKDAAKALNIHSGTVSSRIKNGWLGYFYEDEGQRVQSKEILGRYRKQVVVEGKEFISASEASRVLGMTVKMISRRISYGWKGYYYVENGQLPRKKIWDSRKDKVPVVIRGKRYSTIAEAVKATGESTAKVSKRCLSSNFPEYSRLDKKVEEKLTTPKFPEEVSIESKIFSSIGEAAKFHNLTGGGVSNRCRNNNYPGWFFTDNKKQKEESFTPRFSSKRVQVSVNGVIYESQSFAASVHDIDINTVKIRCRSYFFPTWLCDEVEKQKPKKPTFINIRIEGKDYKSISLASRELGFTRDTIRKRLESVDWVNYIGVLIKP